MRLILLTWELGANLGHATRLLSVAKCLQALGHTVVAAVRDVPSAASILGPGNIPFIQGPCPAGKAISAGPIRSYADILLAQGWRDPAVLWSYVAAWVTLYRALRPDMIVHDASPFARLASKICSIPAMHLGNGYDIPPRTYPLPPFLAKPEADHSEILESEAEALKNANAVLAFYRRPPMEGLRELFSSASVLATFPELDHYGARAGIDYVGILYRSSGETISPAWPPSKVQHVFAYLRQTPRLSSILQGLEASGFYATCFVPGIGDELIGRFQTSRIRLHTQPILFDSVYDRTSVCLSYGAEGTVASFLLAGIPQVLIPSNIEGELTAERVRQMGSGLAMKGWHGSRDVRDALHEVARKEVFKQQAGTFAARYPDHDPDRAAGLIVTRLLAMVGA